MPLTAYAREQEISTVGGTRIGGGRDTRRTWKTNVVNCCRHVVQRGHTFVMITIRRSARHYVDREDVGEGKEKRNNSAFACIC
jgi:hypothetical protein